MEYSIPELELERRPGGLSYALGSLYDRFQRLSDPRKAKGKRYSLLTLLVVIFLAKLSGQDKPGEIADWAKNHADSLVELLQLRQAWMPHHNTIRRVFQAIVSEAEFEQLLEAYTCTTVRCVSPAARGHDWGDIVPGWQGAEGHPAVGSRPVRVRAECLRWPDPAGAGPGSGRDQGK